jgi:hypothetical protein
MYTDQDLHNALGDIDRTLDTTSAWLTPTSRGSLLAARDVVERVLKRRRMPWGQPMMDAAD